MSATIRPQCPACGTETNTYGQPLVSEWAVATHLAGKIRSWDRQHQAWARHHVPTADFSASGNVLATQLLAQVREAMRTASETAERSRPSPLDLLHDLEIRLHTYVRQTLEDEYGVEGDEWWVKGVPLDIRQECMARREADPGRDQPFGYTYLMDLKKIVEKSWALFEADARRTNVDGHSLSKKDVLEWLQRANDTRNRYAHPVRAPQRGTPEFEADCEVAARALAVVSELTTR